MCRVEDLSRKEVINLMDGSRLGTVDDVEFDECDGRISALVVYGRARFFGLFGRGEDIVIPWCDIQKIGEDIILIHHEFHFRARPVGRGAVRGFFR